MTKSFYLSLICCGTLYLIATAVQISAQYHFDTSLYQLPSFLTWLAVAFANAMIWFFALLAYHRTAGHRSTFIFLTIHLYAVVARYYVLYLVFYNGNHISLYFPSYFLVLCTGIFYGGSLIFSGAANPCWLRSAGWYIVGLTTVLLVTLVIYLYLPNGEFKTLVEAYHNKLSWFSELVVLLFIKNWAVGRKLAEGDVGKRSPFTFSTVIILAAAVCSVASVAVGLRLYNEKPITGFSEPVATSRDIAYAGRFEPRTYMDKRGQRISYRLMIPMRYDPTIKYPLVLCLHGGAGWGTDNIKQVAGSLPAVMFSNYLVREKYPAFLVVPQISAEFSWGGLPGLPAADSIVVNLLTSLEKEFSIDRARRYVAGNSLGGYGAWYFIGKHPDLFAAAIPISGEGDPGLARQMSGVSIWAFHGAKDINVPVSGSRRVISALRKIGAAPRYDEYPDDGHDIWHRVIDTPGLIEWLFTQKKK